MQPTYDPTTTAILVFIVFFVTIMVIAWVLYKLRLWYYDEVIHPVNEEHEAAFYDPINLN